MDTGNLRNALYDKLQEQTVRIINYDKNSLSNWGIFIGLLLAVVQYDMGLDKFHKISESLLNNIYNLGFHKYNEPTFIIDLLNDPIVKEWLTDNGDPKEMSSGIALTTLSDMWDRGVLRINCASIPRSTMFCDFERFLSNCGNLQIKILMADYLALFYSIYHNTSYLNLGDSILLKFYENIKDIDLERISSVFNKSIISDDNYALFRGILEESEYTIGYKEDISSIVKKMIPTKSKESELCAKLQSSSMKPLPDGLKKDIIDFLYSGGNPEEIILLCKIKKEGN